MNTAHFNLTREKSEQVEDPRDDGKTLEANDTNTSHNLRRVYSRLTRTVCINVLNQWYQYHSEHPVLLYYLSSIQSWKYWLCFHHGVKLLFLQDKRAKFLSASVSVRNARKAPVFCARDHPFSVLTFLPLSFLCDSLVRASPCLFVQKQQVSKHSHEYTKFRRKLTFEYSAIEVWFWTCKGINDWTNRRIFLPHWLLGANAFYRNSLHAVNWMFITPIYLIGGVKLDLAWLLHTIAYSGVSNFHLSAQFPLTICPCMSQYFIKLSPTCWNHRDTWIYLSFSWSVKTF